MKAKQIEKLLTGVVNNLVESIDVKEIKTIIKERTFITGGCIPSMLIGEFVNDFDIYFYNEVDAANVKDYYSIKIWGKDDKFRVKLITDNAINLSDKVQLITKFVGEPKVVVDNFDFQHIKSHYDCKEGKLHLTPDVYQLVVEKELIYSGSAYPLSSLFRLKKYIKKGWNVSTATMLNIALDIVASFNKMEAERQYESAKHGRLEMQKILDKVQNMTQDDFNKLMEEAGDGIKNKQSKAYSLLGEEVEPVIIKSYTNKDFMTDCELDFGPEPCSELDSFEVITDRKELDFIDKEVRAKRKQTFNVDDIIYHMNGVDPITIQAELIEKAGMYLSIEEIIKLVVRN